MTMIYLFVLKVIAFFVATNAVAMIATMLSLVYLNHSYFYLRKCSGQIYFYGMELWDFFYIANISTPVVTSHPLLSDYY